LAVLSTPVVLLASRIAPTTTVSPATASDGLRFLWDYLGWTGSARPVALGLFGKLHSEFRHYRKSAQRLCQQFDSRYPDANL
jgi:hypothetical protein